jgi:hypothetical protein
MLSFCGLFKFLFAFNLSLITILRILIFTSWCILSFHFDLFLFRLHCVISSKLRRLLMPCFPLCSEHGVKQREQGPDSHRVDCQQAGAGMQVRLVSWIRIRLDLHRFGSPGSGSILGMRIRIQGQYWQINLVSSTSKRLLYTVPRYRTFVFRSALVWLPGCGPWLKWKKAGTGSVLKDP